MATSPRFKKCQGCKHHVSVHAYDSTKPNAGPLVCKVPGCSCKVFVRYSYTAKSYVSDGIGSDGMRGTLMAMEAERTGRIPK